MFSLVLTAALSPVSGKCATSADGHESAPTAWADSVRKALSARAHEVAESGRRAVAWTQHGVASWYGSRFHGRRTSSGSRFDRMALTAAHPTLPLGTKILVHSEDTGRSVVVTVNDRGPFNHRIIDLSQAAAERLGMTSRGLAHVALTPLDPNEDSAAEVAQAPDAKPVQASR